MILAGGTGSRLDPITRSINKHLLPVFDKPMIYYPLATLILAGITELTIVTSQNAILPIRALLGNGEEFGIHIQYREQLGSDGLPSAIQSGLALNSHTNDLLVMLGDNIFHGIGLGRNLGKISQDGIAHIHAIEVKNPQEFGVVILNSENNILDIIEKPRDLVSKFAIPGLYHFPKDLSSMLSGLTKSSRNEYEIVDLLRKYLEDERLSVQILDRGTHWFDGGTVDSLVQASEFVRGTQERLGTLVGSPHEAAYVQGLISRYELVSQISKNSASRYWKNLSLIL